MSLFAPILVTGSSGFIGSHVVQRLLDQGLSVRGFQRSALSSEDPIANHPRYEFCGGDILDQDAVDRAVAGCRSVIHLAAYAKNWSRDPQDFFRFNVEGTRHVMEAAKRHRIERIVHASSIVTFGPTMPGIVGNEELRRCTQHYFTEYEETKAIAEREVIAMANDGLPAVVVNPTRVYGPGKLTEGNALTKMFLQHARGQQPILLNHGINVGNYVHVDDLADGILAALQRGRIGERYILGGENVSLAELLRIVEMFCDQKHFQINFSPRIALAYAQFQKWLAEWLGIYPQITPGWVRTFLVNWVFESKKAERELGYTSRPLKQGIQQTMAWLKHHP